MKVSVIVLSGLQADPMNVTGRHCVFFEVDESRILVVPVLHDRMDYPRHLNTDADQLKDA